MAALIPGTPVTDAALLAALPGTTEQVRSRLLALVPPGNERAELCGKLTANVVVWLLAKNAKRLGVTERIVRRPYATVTQQRRYPEGQRCRFWERDRSYRRLSQNVRRNSLASGGYPRSCRVGSS